MSVVLRIHLGEHASTYSVEGQLYAVPVGADTLAAMVVGDPPLPEELTNAIGLLLDHLEDVTREVPAADLADSVEISGPGLDTIVAVEVGGHTPLPFTLSRAAAEDVFRTLVTESLADRVNNPGLPAEQAHRVLGVSCAVVAVLRGLRLDEVVVVSN